MHTIQTLIVDGNAADRRALRALLRQETDIDLIGEYGCGRDAARALQAHQPDLVLMSVALPDENGFDVLTSFESRARPTVIFLATHESFAVRAFELHAVDYLLKPVRRRRLRDALTQARYYLRGQRVAALYQQIADSLTQLAAQSASEPPTYMQRIPVRNGSRVSFIDVATIDWLEAADNYVCLHVGTQRHYVRSTLSELDEKLDPDQFLRIHRSRIVNIERIREVHPRGSGDSLIVLTNGTELLASRTYGDRRRDALRPFA
jgi:two-component system LytT family response regulator